MRLHLQEIVTLDKLTLGQWTLLTQITGYYYLLIILYSFIVKIIAQFGRIWATATSK